MPSNPDLPKSSETRARRKIRIAAEARGLVVSEMYWEPIGQMIEMSGREGGWTVFFEGGGHALGYSADDVVAWIERGMADPVADALSTEVDHG